MQNLRTLRQRIRSVQSTQKITRAMQMVAGAKLRRLQTELVGFKPYAHRLEDLTRRFLGGQPGLTHPFLEAAVSVEEENQEETPPPIGLVIISSDTGLCGTYNERILSEAERFLLENPSAVTVAVGKKASRFLHRRGKKSIKEMLDWGGRYDMAKMLQTAAWLQELYLNKSVSGWWVVYTGYLSALRWKPTVERYLPVEKPAAEEFPEKIISEPNPEAVADDLLRRFMSAQFVRMILEAFTVEHSARMIAMKNATDNAAEMIETLTLIRNKARQAAITKELIEVVSGAEALR